MLISIKYDSVFVVVVFIVVVVVVIVVVVVTVVVGPTNLPFKFGQGQEHLRY